MKVSRGARRLFQLIDRFIHNRGAFFASQEWTAKHLKTSMRSVQRWTSELVDGGYVIHSSGKQRSATYRILKQLGPIVAGHSDKSGGSFGGSLAGHLKEERFNSLRESEFPSEILKAPVPAVVEYAAERLANKNLKSQIAAQLRSSNGMPVAKMPPVPERFRDAVRRASGDYR